VTNQGVVATPALSSPPLFSYSPLPNLTFSSATSGASIYATYDGTNPDSNTSPLVTNALHIWEIAGKTVKAIATKVGFLASTYFTLSSPFSYPPLATGQSNCFDSSYNPISCTASTSSQDAGYEFGISRANSYTITASSGEATTYDSNTGLTWKTCSEGGTYNSGTCSGYTLLNWTQASSACSALNTANSGNGYANKKNWRLPSAKELNTLTDLGVSPATNSSGFPGVVGGKFWTKTYVTSASTYLTISSADGDHYLDDGTASALLVRCVSSNSTGDPETPNLVDLGDGTVEDLGTGLIWQKCQVGQDPTTCSGGGGYYSYLKTWDESQAYCENLSLANKKWRLPNKNELITILDYKKISTTNTYALHSIFPANVGGTWSSTTGGSGLAFYINTISSDVHGNYAGASVKTAGYFQKCVTTKRAFREFGEFQSILNSRKNTSGAVTVDNTSYPLPIAATGGSYNYYGAVLARNGKLYGIPMCSPYVSVLNPNTIPPSFYTIGPSLPGCDKYAGGVLGLDGKIYGIPYNAGNILVIDPITDTVTTISPSVSITGMSFRGGVMGTNGNIYAIPVFGRKILKFNPSSGVSSFLSTEIVNGSYYDGGALAPNGKIYSFPRNGGLILVIDPSNDSVSQLSLGLPAVEFNGTVLGLDGKLYGIPFISDKVWVLDPSNNSLDSFGSVNSNLGYFGGALAGNGKIYAAPYGAGSVLEIDPYTKSTQSIGSISGSNPYIGSTLAADGKIYSFPFNHPNLLIIDPKSTKVWPRDVLVSPYFNKY
jgi:hypothetical protein